MYECEELMENWIFNKFYYYGDFVVAIYGVDHKTKKYILFKCKNVEYKKLKIKTLILLPPQWQHFFSIGGFDSLFYSLFFNTFQCFSLIMLWYFNLFLVVSQNLNGPTNL